MWYRQLSMVLWDRGKRYHWTHDSEGKLVYHNEVMETCARAHYNQNGVKEE